MSPDNPPVDALPVPTRTLVAVGGGVAYAVAVFAWAFATGVRFGSDDLGTVLVGGGYAGLGMFLIAAVPLYLLGWLSLVTPLAVAGWSLANVVYLRRYVPRPHDALASYLTVWGIYVALLLAAAALEGVVRVGIDRTAGRFGLRTLF